MSSTVDMNRAGRQMTTLYLKSFAVRDGGRCLDKHRRYDWVIKEVQ